MKIQKKIADFDIVEDFWRIFQHLKEPEILHNGVDFNYLNIILNPYGKMSLIQKEVKYQLN